jgi:hypothetical protein
MRSARHDVRMSLRTGIIVFALVGAGLTGCVPAASAPPEPEGQEILPDAEVLERFAVAEQQLDALHLDAALLTGQRLSDAADDIREEWDAQRLRINAELDPTASQGKGTSVSFDVFFDAFSTWAFAIGLLGTDVHGSTSHGPTETRGGISATESTTVSASLRGPVADVLLSTVRSESGPGGWTVTQTSTAQIELPLCPDPDGVIEYDTSLVLDTVATAGTARSTVHSALSGHTRGVVGENGELATLSVSGDFVHRTEAQGEGLLGPTGTNEVSVTSVPGSVTSSVTAGDVAPTQVSDITALGGVLTWLAGALAMSKATEKFEHGYCTTITVDPKSAVTVVAEGATQEFDVSVTHAFEGTELDDPITTTLSGAESVTPTAKTPTPATITYTAPDERNQTATIEVVSRSRRGIGFATIKVKTPGGYAIHDTWTVQNGEIQTIDGVSCESPYGPWHLELSGDLSGWESFDADYDVRTDPATGKGELTGSELSVDTTGGKYEGTSVGTSTITEAGEGYLMALEIDYDVIWTQPPPFDSAQDQQRLTGHISRQVDIIAATDAECS